MSKPDIIPDTTTAGIALDPRTLERVIPESRRPDGSVRKQIKIRPGFTPQEDVRRFRGTRQAEMDARTLPKGHVVGWAPPSAAAAPKAPLSKNAKKHEKRKEKRKEKRDEPVRENWEDDDDDDGAEGAKAAEGPRGADATAEKGAHTPGAAEAPDTKESAAVRQKAQSATAEDLSEELAKLKVR